MSENDDAIDDNEDRNDCDGSEPRGYGFVPRDPRRFANQDPAAGIPSPIRGGTLPNVTTPPYPIRVQDESSTSGSPIRAGTLPNLTTPPYPVRVLDQATGEPSPLRAGWLPIFTTTPYPARAGDEAAAAPVVVAAGFYRWSDDYLTIAADISDINVFQTFFPVEYFYLLEGQDDGSFHEDITVASDVSGIFVGTTFHPFEYFLVSWGGDDPESGGEPPPTWPDHEDVAIAADVSGIFIGETFFPIDYLNLLPDELEISADITALTVSTP